MNTNLAGEVAIVTFIFAEPSARKAPDGVDRQVLYFASILALLLAFGLLLWIIHTVKWRAPHSYINHETLKKDYKTYKKFLEYIHDDYLEVVKHCGKIVDNKCKKFNWIAYLLSGSVILLLLITKFGGRI